MRANDTLKKIKEEIEKDPMSLGYGKLSSAEISKLLNSPRDTGERKSVSYLSNARQYLLFLSNVELDKIMQFLTESGMVPPDMIKDTEVSVYSKRSDELSLGEVTQGEIEVALKYKEKSLKNEDKEDPGLQDLR